MRLNDENHNTWKLKVVACVTVRRGASYRHHPVFQGVNSSFLTTARRNLRECESRSTLLIVHTIHMHIVREYSIWRKCYVLLYFIIKVE